MRWPLAVVVLIIALAVPGSAGADVFSELDEPVTIESGPTISIASDKPDYAPGELVTLTGSGWQPGEGVAISVVADGGEQPWQYDVTVTADENGDIVDQFHIAAFYVAQYYVTATGEYSGVATTSFTDSLTDYQQGTTAVGGSPACTNPGNVLVSDDVRARCFRGGNASTISGDEVIVSGFNLQSVVPSTATGIRLAVEVEAVSGGSPPVTNRQAAVALSWNNGANFTPPPTNTGQIAQSPPGPPDAFYTVPTTGGNPPCSDFNHTWTWAELSNATFLVRVAPINVADSNDFIDIDRIRVRACYTGATILQAAADARTSAVATSGGLVRGSVRTHLMVSQWRATSYQFEGGSVQCGDHGNPTGTAAGGPEDQDFDMNVPSAHGTYDVTYIAYGTDNCTGTPLSPPFTLADAVTVGIFGDSFGINTVEGNYGDDAGEEGWTDGDIAGDNCNVVNGVGGVVDLDRYMRLRRRVVSGVPSGCAFTKSSISTAGLENIHLKYRWGQDTTIATPGTLTVEWKKSSDSSWSAVNTHTLANSSGTPTIPNSVDFALPAAAAKSSIDIRFTGPNQATSPDAQRALVDDVLVTGDPASNDATFTVTKAYSPSGSGAVDVTLDCSNNAFDDASKTAGPGSPAVFTLSGFPDGMTCSATEDTVPAGHTVSYSGCSNVAITDGGNHQCDITNTVNSATITVEKVYSDSSTTPVDIGLTCDGDGSIDDDSQQATPGGPDAVFTVTGFTAGDECRIIENPIPAGYHALYNCDDSNTRDVTLAVNGTHECTVRNEVNSATITVGKVYSDSSTAPAVDIGLSCTSGQIDDASQQATPGGPDAVFTITKFTAGDPCTVSETTVPAGYTESYGGADCNGSGSLNLVIGQHHQCTVTNTLNSATITVDKVYSDSKTDPVDVGLACDGGGIDDDSQQATPGGPDAVFTVTGFTVGDECRIIENPIPAGYHAKYNCDDSNTRDVTLALNGTHGCTITNELNSATITVGKVYSDSSTDPVDIGLQCAGNGLIDDASQEATPGGPDAVFTITKFTGGDTCTVSETTVPPGYTVSYGGTDCSSAGSVTLVIGQNHQCTVTNTLNSATVQVAKDFTDDSSSASVDVTLTCDSPAVVADPNPAAATDSAAAEFTVTKFTDDTTCDAAEDGEAGYTETASCDAFKPSEADEGPECSITNTLNSATITVEKVYSDNDGTPVDVSVDCGDAAGDESSDSADPDGDPNAEFTITGFDAGDTCTVSEDVPAGYTRSFTDGECDTDGAITLAVNGEHTCEITNTLNSATVQVAKDFTDDDPSASVDVTLTCDSPAVVADPNPAAATDSAAAEFTVTKFTDDTTCDAAEDGEAGYTETASCDAFKPSEADDGPECSITNTLNSATITVEKDFQPNNASGEVTVSLDCGADVDVTAQGGDNTATEADAVEFTVERFVTATRCDATESGEPAGYTKNESGCQDVDPNAAEAGRKCTIVNKQNVTYVNVRKDFQPDNAAASVTVSLTCESGVVTTVGGDNTASESDDANFKVTGFTNGHTCDAGETGVPPGYTPDLTGCENISLATSPASCEIRNVQSQTLVTAGGCSFDRDTSRNLQQFPLIFTPDGSPASKLSATNPGQFFMNAAYSGSSSTMTINIPYPFVTVGPNAVRIFDGVTSTTTSGKTCFTPENHVGSDPDQVTWNFGPTGTPNTFGQTKPITVNVPPGGFAYVRVHLAYGLKGVAGGCTGGSQTPPTATCTAPSSTVIAGYKTYLFSFGATSPSFNASGFIESFNVFKKNPGIGGLVTQTGSGTPVGGATVQIYQGTIATGTPKATVTTDTDGWYMWSYKYTGKATSFTVKLPGYPTVPAQTVTLKSNGYLSVNFNNVP